MGGRFGELLLILLIVFLIFGSRRLKDFGGDLGAAIKGFKKNVGTEDDKLAKKHDAQGVTIDGKAETVSAEKTDANDQNKS
ncbi:MAG: twin-arginine translocase TatA/TatE family subunit [Spongiibacteraceae bacterium]